MNNPVNAPLLVKGRCGQKRSGLEPRALQTKLVVNQPGDRFEQEADRIAEFVLDGDKGRSPLLSRVRPNESPAMAAAPSIVSEALSQPGEPLDSSTRLFMESRFGYDFSSVRVHNDAKAAESARAVSALAYTVGNHIAFDSTRPSSTTLGRHKLLAHELAHVVQQSGVHQNNGSCVVSAISQPVAEGGAITHRVQRQPDPLAEIEMPAEYVFAIDVRKRTDKNYAWSQGRKDAARIQKSGKLSSEDKQEVIAKLRFFQREAKKAYMQLIQPALLNYTEDVLEILQESASPGVGGHGTQKPTCDIGQQQFLLEYEDEPGKARCIDRTVDPEFRKDYFDFNIGRAVGYTVEGTTWENVEYQRFKVLLVTYKNRKSEYFMLNEIGEFHYDDKARIHLEHTYLKRGNGLIYPTSHGRIYLIEALTPNIIAWKNGLRYQVKELQDLYTLVETTGAFASIISANTLVAGFKESLEGFRSVRSSRPKTTETPTLAPAKRTNEPVRSPAPATTTRRPTPPPTSEEVGGGRTRSRISPLDRGKGARPFYADDPKRSTAPGKPAITRAPEVIDQELVSVGPKGARYEPAPAHGVDPYQNYVAARDSASRSAGIGKDAVPHFAKDVGPGSAHLVGRQNGSMSPDGTRGWRLDYSPKKGGHINWWRIEGGTEYRGSISIWGVDEATFLKLLQGHFGVPPH